MDGNLATTVSLHGQKYDDVINSLELVTNKSAIESLKITDTSLIELNETVLEGFDNLTDLELSNCDIYMFADNVFEHLINLKVLNLSNNAIFSIEDSLFRTNNQLKTVIFKNNKLNSINKVAFANLKCLEILDFSFNTFEMISENCLDSVSLKKFYLRCNEIFSIAPNAFNLLPNLTHVVLENNKITYLEEQVFYPTKNLRYLNLSNNVIREINGSFCWRLTKLQSIHLEGNQLTQTFDKNFFINNNKLIDINLTDNNITVVGKETFKRCKNLKFLNVKVSQNFEISSIKYLKFLTKFKLYCNVDQELNLMSSFWVNIKYNKMQLTVLIIIFKKINYLKFTRFTDLKNLECLHIECKQPKNTKCTLKFYSHFRNLHVLQKIVLKNLNLSITSLYLDDNRMRYFDLSGIRNTNCDYDFKHLTFLRHLNLSYSELNDINQYSFYYLVSLEHLDLSHTKIKSISALVFQNNVKLTYLNCSNCLINTIEDFTFQHLDNLTRLDLSNNLLQHTIISDNVFSGLREDKCLIIL